MKINYIENVRVPSERAHAYQITTTCAWMAKLGHRVTLINPDRTDQDVFAFFDWPKDLFTHVRIRSWDPLSRAPAFLKGIGYVLQRAAFIRHARSIVRSHEADVWYTRDLAMADACMGGTSAPWFIELHDEPTTNVERWNRVKHRIAGFVVISQGLRSRLIELGIAEHLIHMAPDGFEPREFERMGSRDALRDQFQIPRDAFGVFYSGSFYAWKGLDPVLQAWPKTNAHAHLVLLGGPDGERTRIERVIPADARARIHIIPALPRREGIAMYAIGDIGLLASSPNQEISRSYTSPLKLFEYLAAGLPVLASNVPSSRDVLTDEIARFFGSGEPEFLATLTAVQADQDWVKLASSRARAFVEPYSWEARTRKILNFIGQL
jgi:glycosyltransferase involved in cell wall biosynthesis